MKKKPITYAISFAKAAQLTSDAQINNAVFATALARALTENLNLQGFELATDSATADQLLVVHAGTTQPPHRFSSHDEMFSVMPSLEDGLTWIQNTELLGYARAYNDLSQFAGMSLGQTMRQDLNDDLDSSRNYIVITAYDFGAAQSGQRAPVLWRTHVSVEAGIVPLSDQVDTLLATASGFLGRNSKRLIRRFNSEVQIGTATVVEEDVR
ncbi:hypothetical protein [Synoicihabitans lomoniglobus]|uniref:Uncharacterized protein n=1 Tax=Synoicihabitans lomoniglobus TaxID=2909285 RepID=A0AAE9ZXG1_9BACT|nr:hypothetical protein [Opitutaceae bacterium LMO-M01]WED64889.1 hypothetical protein PXH66_21290 [Opitutaceae bacterium LMO-M01]